MAMIRVRRGKVLEIRKDGEPQEILVKVSDSPVSELALNYQGMSGPVKPGDEVLLNTTAVHLGLGTGGRHFVISVIGQDDLDCEGPGHIMKLRYTPMQIKCLSVEEDESPHHDVMAAAQSLGGMPVLAATLHSMVPAMAYAVKAVKPGARIAYIMTDGAALPIALSRTVAQLKELGMIDATITAGNAFGGDYEAVNVHTALLAARHVVMATHTIIAMGPGIVGTGTPFGFTGVEQADIINAINNLSGTAYAVLRISFTDSRPRHRGVSHHSLTALGRLTNTRATIGIPDMHPEERTIVEKQLSESGILTKHRIIWDIPSDAVLDRVESAGIRLSTMGRGVEKERTFFLTAVSSGILAGQA